MGVACALWFRLMNVAVAATVVVILAMIVLVGYDSGCGDVCVL